MTVKYCTSLMGDRDVFGISWKLWKYIIYLPEQPKWFNRLKLNIFLKFAGASRNGLCVDESAQTEI